MVAAVILPIATAPPAKAAAAHNVPAQFIAKLYTEAFGVAPPSPQWGDIQNFFLNPANGCTTPNLSTWGKTIYKSLDLEAHYPLADATPDKHILSARIVSLFRGALNREPDLNELSGNWNSLKSSPTQATWNAIVDGVFNSASFDSLVNDATYGICRNTAEPTRRDPAAYGWNAQYQIEPVSVTSGSTCGFQSGTTRETLQNTLNGPAQTVLLGQGAYIRLDAQLVIPPGKTLRTCGDLDDDGIANQSLPDPLPSRYALQARLIRTWDRATGRTWPTAPAPGMKRPLIATVRLETGAKLDRVWIDGNRNRSTNNCWYGPIEDKTDDGVHNPKHQVHELDAGCHNVTVTNRLCPGQTGSDVPNCAVDTQVTNSRLSNSGGGTTLSVLGNINVLEYDENDVPITAVCRGLNTIRGNLVTGYAQSHLADQYGGALWGDGITVNCENSIIDSNTVVDATDVPIILWRPCLWYNSYCWDNFPQNRVQTSDITNNTVVAAGNSNWGAIWHSTGEANQWYPEQAPVSDFTGATVTGNHLFTSVAASMHALIVSGMRTISGIIPGRTIPNGVTANGSKVATSADLFEAGDVGRQISGPGIPDATMVLSIKCVHTCDPVTKVGEPDGADISNAATATASGLTFTIGLGRHPDWTTRGTGASYTGNDTRGELAYVNVAVIASGIREVTITNNQFDRTRVAYAGWGGLTKDFPGWKCGEATGELINDGRAPIIVEQYSPAPQNSFYWASGVFGPNYQTKTFDTPAVTGSGNSLVGCMAARMHA